MPFEPLHARLPELAEAETRIVTVLENHGGPNRLPPADYAFLELFCNEPGCDCRRVFFTVVSSRTQASEAIIAYGWENADFHRKWYKHGTEEDIAMLQGPELNVGSPQGRYSEAILQLFIYTLLPQSSMAGAPIRC
jgi:hypothetical protein